MKTGGEKEGNRRKSQEGMDVLFQLLLFFSYSAPWRNECVCVSLYAYTRK